MSVSTSEIADFYRRDKASGRQLTRTKLDYYDKALRPGFLDGDGRLDISTRDDFTDEEVAYAGVLGDIVAAKARRLTEEEYEFVEVVLRSAYMRKIETDAIEREDADRERERAAERDAQYGSTW
jgi:hypothetical protein